MSNLSSFYSVNYLEESMSFIEKAARKLIPILTELKKKMIPEKNMKEINKVKSKGKIETLESCREDSDYDMDIFNNDASSKNK
jgi:hypothetical protein